jgi:hypothetical protein
MTYISFNIFITDESLQFSNCDQNSPSFPFNVNTFLRHKLHADFFVTVYGYQKRRNISA